MFSIRAPPVSALITLCKPVAMAEMTGIVAAVAMLRTAFGEEAFQASDACRLAELGKARNSDQEDLDKAREFRMALDQVGGGRPLGKDISPIVVSWRLRAMCGVPCRDEGKIVTLRVRSGNAGNKRRGTWFEVEEDR
jgi:hypothetical protein